MNKKSARIAAFFSVLLLGAFLYFFFFPVVTRKEGAIYYVRPGVSKLVVLQELKQQGVLSHPYILGMYVYLDNESTLRAGEYFFPKGSTPLSIWWQITSGKGLAQYPFAIIPGWSFKQVKLALAQTEKLNHATTSLTDQQLMEKLGATNLNPEGQFLPETYFYTRGLSDMTILKRAYVLMQKKLTEAWEERAADLPYKNAYEALIAASLVEKEAYLASERPIIAGVLINRLEKNMLLQFDPTVIYGMGDRYQGKIYKKDLKENTPYNTYIHKGLPPTPIAMPSFAAIQAALHPEKHEYFYFVARGDGSHEFTNNLNQHHQAVSKAVQVQSKKNSYMNETLLRQYFEKRMERLQIKNGDLG